MKNILRKCNLKVTKGRVEVLELLKERQKPMTSEEVYSIIPRSVCSSLSTVYRILNQLSDKKVLDKKLMQNGITYYEFANDEHKHHIVCSKCGKIEEIKGCPIIEEEQKIEKDTGYSITNHLLEFTGICPECMPKSEKEI